MRRAFTFIALVWLIAVVAVVAIGCQQKADSAAAGGMPVNESVVDVGGGYQQDSQQPSQVAPQPVVYDTVATPAPGNPTDASDASMAVGDASGGSYTVKKGDTLYGIARVRYGDGKQWVRIAEANPGLRPESLKAGQTIMVP